MDKVRSAMNDGREMLSNRKVPFSNRPLPTKVMVSYVLDYVIIVILAILFAAIDKVNGYRQPFSLENYTLHYPFAVHERVTPGACYVIVVICPALIICVWTLVIDGLFGHDEEVDEREGRRIGRYRLVDRMWELNCGILGLALSEGMAFVITGTFKNIVGKPRPDLIDRCQPVAGSTTPHWGLSNSTICTQTDESILKDGFRSFPSGHSSSSFAGLFYLSLYLAAKLHIWDSRGEVWKVFVVIIPTIGAGLVAASRIMDARHHPFDVITGSLLGIACAWTAYRQYFPPVSETWRKGRAYPIRSWGKGTLAPPAATTTAYSPYGSREMDSSPAPQQRRQHTRVESDSNSMLASHAAPLASQGLTAGASVGNSGRRRDEWEEASSTEDEEYEMQRQTPRYPPGATVDTAYAPRAHLGPSDQV